MGVLPRLYASDLPDRGLIVRHIVQCTTNVKVICAMHKGDIGGEYWLAAQWFVNFMETHAA